MSLIGTIGTIAKFVTTNNILAKLLQGRKTNVTAIGMIGAGIAAQTGQWDAPLWVSVLLEILGVVIMTLRSAIAKSEQAAVDAKASSDKVLLKVQQLDK